MSVLVDTCIWSTAFRLRSSDESTLLAGLIDAQRVALLGAVRQEASCGIREPARFELIRMRLAMFPNVPVGVTDYETAASFYNLCRGRGVQGSSTDFLLCAVSARLRLPIYTVDKDFSVFATLLPISLFRVVF